MISPGRRKAWLVLVLVGLLVGFGLVQLNHSIVRQRPPAPRPPTPRSSVTLNLADDVVGQWEGDQAARFVARWVGANHAEVIHFAFGSYLPARFTIDDRHQYKVLRTVDGRYYVSTISSIPQFAYSVPYDSLFACPLDTVEFYRH